jgi:hypothetical protein
MKHVISMPKPRNTAAKGRKRILLLIRSTSSQFIPWTQVGQYHYMALCAFWFRSRDKIISSAPLVSDISASGAANSLLTPMG